MEVLRLRTRRAKEHDEEEVTFMYLSGIIVIGILSALTLTILMGIALRSRTAQGAERRGTSG